MIVDNTQIIEALIFASDEPLAARKIKDILENISVKEIKEHVNKIRQRYDEQGSPMQIIEVAEGFQIVTRPELATWLKKLYNTRSASRLTQKSLETLAIVAYKQPITRTEIESIRGVSADSVVHTLIERDLIKVVGREKAPGNPLLYGTTKYFLEFFGLNSIGDLPKLKEIDELLKGDEQFLESLDQVALQQILPEELGLSSMLNTNPEGDAESESTEQGNTPEEPDISDETVTVPEKSELENGEVNNDTSE